MIRVRVTTLALGALLALGCEISPQPAPPGTTPEIRAEAITITSLDAQTIEVRGSSGAAPEDATLALANIERAEVDASVQTDAQGGFSVVLAGELTDLLRLFVSTPEGADEIDVTGTTSGGNALEVAPAFADCLSVAPSALAFGPVALADPIEIRSLIFTNACDQPLVVSAVDVRDASEFVLLAPGPGQLPLSIAAGGQANVDVGYKSPAAGSFGDFARVRFTDAAGPRRIIALSGESVP